jgi:hypothetical protein
MSEPFSLSPSSLLNLSPDFNSGVESSQPSETNPASEPHALESGVQLDAIQENHSRRQYNQESARTGTAERHQQQRRNELHDAPQRLSTMSFASTMLPPYSEPPSYTNRPLSPVTSRNSASLNNQSRTDSSAHMIDLDQQEGFALTPISGNPDCNSGHGGDFQGSYNMQQRASNLDTDPDTFIRKLSNINVDLHRHLRSMPPVEVQQNTRGAPRDRRTSNSFGSAPRGKELLVDRAFQLSHHYTETLNDLLYAGSTTAAIASDQPSQLLVLSSYLCLVELYDKILQHIKAFTEVQLKMGVFTSDERFSIQMPNLTIGCFELPTSSSTQSLVLTCIIEAMMLQIHDLVSEMTKSAGSSDGTAKTSDATPAENDVSSDDGLSSVAKITLQAINAKESSTLELINAVRRLALQRVTL